MSYKVLEATLVSEGVGSFGVHFEEQNLKYVTDSTEVPLSLLL